MSCQKYEVLPNVDVYNVFGNLKELETASKKILK